MLLWSVCKLLSLIAFYYNRIINASLGIVHIHCGSGTKSGTALRILLYLESNPLLCKPSVIRPEYAPALSGALKGAGLINDCTGFLDTWCIRSTPIPALTWFCGLINESNVKPNKPTGKSPTELTLALKVSLQNCEY